MDRASRTAQKADLVLAVYTTMTPRSLRGLADQMQALGIAISLATLKRWSGRYGWQARVAAVDAAAAQQHEAQHIARLVAMSERHVQLSRGLLSAGGAALQRLLADDPRLGTLKANEIARLLELGLRAEREATHAALDRAAIATDIWNGVVTTVGGLFSDCNETADATARAQRFAAGLDALVDRHLAALTNVD